MKKNILITGFPGSGKTTLLLKVAEALSRREALEEEIVKQVENIHAQRKS